MDYEKLATQRYELANTPEIWQFDLLTPQKLYQFAKDRDIPVFNADTVTALWRVGLLRADLITATSKLEIPAIELVSEDDGLFIYCDKRQVEHRIQSYGGTLAGMKSVSDYLELLFHPFRLYVLYHINRVFLLNTASTQYLLYPEGWINIAKRKIDNLNQWTSDKKFTERFEHWNRTAELAIVLEPTTYTMIFHEIRWWFPDTQDTLEAKLRERRETVRELLAGATAKQIKEIREELCQNAGLLDKNKLVHVLLRLMSRQQRLNLRSALGGCMQFLCMAEIIRRAVEDTLGQELPEEDEMGFGQWMDGARKTIYGSERILDSSRETRREFLTSMELDYGVKVRCYVEGETEFGALTSAVGEAGGTEFVNLHGQVIESRRKGLSFADSLKNEMTSHIFSVVVLDEDREGCVRALKQAVRNETFFGSFFISSPDVEFANFTVSELLDIVLDLAGQDDDEVPTRDQMMPLVAHARSNKQLSKILVQNGLPEIRKNETWGIALMKYALQHEKLPQNHIKAGKTRPIIEAARFLISARNAGYLRSRERFRVDPDTGELQKK